MENLRFSTGPQSRVSVQLLLFLSLRLFEKPSPDIALAARGRFGESFRITLDLFMAKSCRVAATTDATRATSHQCSFLYCASYVAKDCLQLLSKKATTITAAAAVSSSSHMTATTNEATTATLPPFRPSFPLQIHGARPRHGKPQRRGVLPYPTLAVVGDRGLRTLGLQDDDRPRLVEKPDGILDVGAPSVIFSGRFCIFRNSKFVASGRTFRVVVEIFLFRPFQP